MKKASFSVFVAFTALFLCFAVPHFANAQQYQPYVGQQGKDVIWVPTPEDLVQGMLDMAKVTPTDYVIDLGSGDGRIVIAAAKRGARAVGFEFNPDMVELSRKNAEKAGVSDKATFVNADIFASDFSQATVITMYLLPQLNLKLRPKILDLKPGTRVVSHAFDMGEWPADQTIEQQGRTAYLQLTQKFQSIEGTLTENGEKLEIENGKLEGDHISFTARGQAYSGRVNGKSIEGTVNKSGLEQKWSALRS
jgi:SAM-dependent methyltransferase